MNDPTMGIGNFVSGVTLRIPRSVALAVLACVLAGAGTDLRAQGMFGFGIVIGEPTGLAWKYKINHINAVDGTIGFAPDDAFRINVDYLWHAYPFEEQHLAVHYGLGAAFGFGRTESEFPHNHSFAGNGEDLGFGIRGVVGLTYSIPRSPVDLFFEIAPLIVAAPEGGFGLDVGLGVRVYP